MCKRSLATSVFFALAPLALHACGAGGPERTVIRFHELVADGEAEEAVELLSSDSFAMVDKSKVVAALRQQALQIDARGGLDDFEITESKEIGEVATVKYEASYGNGDEESGEVTLVREEGDWKIQLAGSK